MVECFENVTAVKIQEYVSVIGLSSFVAFVTYNDGICTYIGCGRSALDAVCDAVVELERLDPYFWQYCQEKGWQYGGQGVVDALASMRQEFEDDHCYHDQFRYDHERPYGRSGAAW